MPNISLSFVRLARTHHKVSKRYHSVNLIVLKIYSVFRTLRILFPGKISIDACLSRIPLDTAICSNNRHVFSRRSHGTRAASWLIISWLSYLKCLQNTALWLGRVHIKHFFSWKVSGQRARKDISKTWPWSTPSAIPPIELTQLWDKESCRR